MIDLTRAIKDIEKAYGLAMDAMQELKNEVDYSVDEMEKARERITELENEDCHDCEVCPIYAVCPEDAGQDDACFDLIGEDATFKLKGEQNAKQTIHNRQR